MSLLPGLTISGFDQASLGLTTNYVLSIALTNMNLDSLQLQAQTIDELKLLDSMIDARVFKLSNLRTAGLNFTEQ